MLNPCFKVLHVVENDGMWECNITSIWIWYKSCHSFFDGVFWSIEPYHQCIVPILIEVIGLNLEKKNVWWGPQSNFFNNIGH